MPIYPMPYHGLRAGIFLIRFNLDLEILSEERQALITPTMEYEAGSRAMGALTWKCGRGIANNGDRAAERDGYRARR